MIRSVRAGGGAKANAFARAGEPLRIDQSIQLGQLRGPQDVVEHQIALKIEEVLLQLAVRSVQGHTLPNLRLYRRVPVALRRQTRWSALNASMTAPALTTRCGPWSGGVRRQARPRAPAPRVRPAPPTALALDCPHGLVESRRTTAYIACCQAIARLDLTHRLPEISIPTMVVVGAGDPATTVEMARTMMCPRGRAS